MVDISLLLPTRSRLESLYGLFDSIVETTAHPDSLEIVLYIDEDDTSTHSVSYPALQVVKLIRPRDAMGRVTNVCYESSHGRYIMLMNDDVVFRTKNWDVKVMKAGTRFREDVALIYGNDMYQKHSLAAFPILSRKTCELMGRVCPDDYEGGFIDAHIFDIFKGLAGLGHDKIIYLPDVIFKHMNLRVLEPIPEETYVSKDPDHDELLYIAWSEERSWIARRLAHYIQSNRNGAKDSYASNIHAIRHVAKEEKAILPRISSRAVSIVMCVDNNLEGTLQSLSSIINSVRQIPFELIIVDNGSTNKVSSSLQKLKDKIIYIRNDEKNSLAGVFNKGAQLAKGNYIVFLKHGTIVQPGWLGTLLKAAKDNNAAVVGCKLLNPRNGRVEHSGISFFKTNGRLKYTYNYKGFGKGNPAVNRIREVQAVSCTGMLVDKGVFLKVGGFDENLTDLENIELCIKIRALGRKVIYAPEATLFYYGQNMMFQDDATDKNWATILTRWGRRIEPDLDKLLREDGFSLHKAGNIHYIFPKEETIVELKSKDKLNELKELLEESLEIVENVEEPVKAIQGTRNDLAMLCCELAFVYSQLRLEKKIHRLYDLTKVYRLPQSVILTNYEQMSKEGDRKLGADALVNMYVGTKFRIPVPASISQISVKMYKQSNPMDDVVAYIYGGSGKPEKCITKAVSNPIPGKNITSERAGEWITFTFPSFPSVSDNSNYWIILQRLGISDESNYYKVKLDLSAGFSSLYACDYYGPEANNGLVRKGVSQLFRVYGRVL